MIKERSLGELGSIWLCVGGGTSYTVVGDFEIVTFERNSEVAVLAPVRAP